MTNAVQADLQVAVNWLRDGPSSELYDMVVHHFGWDDEHGSGKGVRSILCLLSNASAGGEWERAIPIASAIELIHNFSLVHDDIEDGSELRRHRPTVWKLWGVPQAINAGDALYALARLSSNRLLDSGYEPATVLSIQNLLDESCLDLTRGQYLDLEFQTDGSGLISRYMEMIDFKTASLIAASTAIGAISGGCREAMIAHYRAFGRHLGLAFQIQDDYLGVWGSEQQTGKPVGNDLSTRKPAYPALYALENSADFAALWTDPSADQESLMVALEQSGAQTAVQEAAAVQTAQAFENLAAAAPAEPAGTALRGLADRLLVRQS